MISRLVPRRALPPLRPRSMPPSTRLSGKLHWVQGVGGGMHVSVPQVTAFIAQWTRALLHPDRPDARRARRPGAGRALPGLLRARDGHRDRVDRAADGGGRARGPAAAGLCDAGRRGAGGPLRRAVGAAPGAHAQRRPEPRDRLRVLHDRRRLQRAGRRSAAGGARHGLRGAAGRRGRDLDRAGVRAALAGADGPRRRADPRAHQRQLVRVVGRLAVAGRGPVRPGAVLALLRRGAGAADRAVLVRGDDPVRGDRSAGDPADRPFRDHTAPVRTHLLGGHGGAGDRGGRRGRDLRHGAGADGRCRPRTDRRDRGALLVLRPVAVPPAVRGGPVAAPDPPRAAALRPVPVVDGVPAGDVRRRLAAAGPGGTLAAGRGDRHARPGGPRLRLDRRRRGARCRARARDPPRLSTTIRQPREFAPRPGSPGLRGCTAGTAHSALPCPVRPSSGGCRRVRTRNARAALERSCPMTSDTAVAATPVEITFPEDPHGMSWLRPDLPYAQVRLPAPVHTEDGPPLLKAEATTTEVGDETRTVCTITNPTDRLVVAPVGEVAITLPLHDRYDDPALCLTNRCHAHLSMSGTSSSVFARRMGGDAPHLGLVLTEGELAAYSIERDLSRSSNDRGLFLLHPGPLELAPGESTRIGW